MIHIELKCDNKEPHANHECCEDLRDGGLSSHYCPGYVKDHGGFYFKPCFVAEMHPAHIYTDKRSLENITFLKQRERERLDLIPFANYICCGLDESGLLLSMKPESFDKLIKDWREKK